MPSLQVRISSPIDWYPELHVHATRSRFKTCVQSLDVAVQQLHLPFGIMGTLQGLEGPEIDQFKCIFLWSVKNILNAFLSNEMRGKPELHVL
jgi:hypothetical protein